jgi:hypothetical protein
MSHNQIDLRLEARESVSLANCRYYTAGACGGQVFFKKRIQFSNQQKERFSLTTVRLEADQIQQEIFP